MSRLKVRSTTLRPVYAPGLNGGGCRRVNPWPAGGPDKLRSLLAGLDPADPRDATGR